MEVDGDLFPRLDVPAGEVVVLFVDLGGRFVGVADVPADGHLVRILGPMQSGLVEHAILEQTIPEQLWQFLGITQAPELVVVLGEERQLGTIRNVLGCEDADFILADWLENKEQHVILLGWFDRIIIT